MIENTIELRSPNAARVITKIPPLIIVAAAGVGSYAAAPTMVGYFNANPPVYRPAQDIKLSASEVKPPVVLAPVEKPYIPPPPPAAVVSPALEEAKAAPPVVVAPAMVAPLPLPSAHPAALQRVPTVRLMPSRMRWHFVRGFAVPPRVVQFRRVMPMLGFVRRFHRF